MAGTTSNLVAIVGTSLMSSQLIGLWDPLQLNQLLFEQILFKKVINDLLIKVGAQGRSIRGIQNI